jgi:hypothetical protein
MFYGGNTSFTVVELPFLSCLYMYVYYTYVMSTVCERADKLN